MCGIAGWFGWPGEEGEAQAAAAAMAWALRCRGPDAEGVWRSEHGTEVHRRLVVVDPEGGGQPMIRRQGERTFAITYNGELYNTEELRRALQARGHRFSTRSDTEVLLTAYLEWGTGCLERLNGIFAFAIQEEPAGRLVLARDRLGVKPLFYARRGGALVYASELKGLLAHPLVQPRVDAEGLAEVFLMAPARTPGHGVFQGVAEVLPGHWLSFDGHRLEDRAYWRLSSHPHPDDPERTARTVRELLEDAVTRQLVADVPVCTFLSGGLDSSAVTAFAARAVREAGRGPLTAFAVDFAGMERDFHPTPFQPDLDGPWARRVAAHLGVELRQVVLDTPELVEHLIPSLRARDLPGMADVDTSLYLLCREVRRSATVALSGEAADEVFGGYPWLFRPEALAADTFPWARRLADRVRLFSPQLIDRIQPARYVERRYREALAEVEPLPGEDPLARRRREVSYLNLSRFLPTLLDRKDRMSMAVGLEVRVPFCDHRLVEYVWNIPWELKAEGGLPKAILRRALAGVLPEDVRLRRKRPYPSTFNPAYGEACRRWIMRLLEDPQSPLRPWIDREAVRHLAQAGLDAPELPWFGQLMGVAQFFAYLIQLDAWFREYRVEVV